MTPKQKLYNRSVSVTSRAPRSCRRIESLRVEYSNCVNAIEFQPLGRSDECDDFWWMCCSLDWEVFWIIIGNAFNAFNALNALCTRNEMLAQLVWQTCWRHSKTTPKATLTYHIIMIISHLFAFAANATHINLKNRMKTTSKTEWRPQNESSLLRHRRAFCNLIHFSCEWAMKRRETDYLHANMLLNSNRSQLDLACVYPFLCVLMCSCDLSTITLIMSCVAQQQSSKIQQFKVKIPGWQFPRHNLISDTLPSFHSKMFHQNT